MKLVGQIFLFSLVCVALVWVVAHNDIRGVGASELAFSLQGSGNALSVPYTLSEHPLVLESQGQVTLTNPSPQKQFLRVTGPQGQYRIRYSHTINVATDSRFTVETVTLTDSTTTSSFEVRII